MSAVAARKSALKTTEMLFIKTVTEEERDAVKEPVEGAGRAVKRPLRKLEALFSKNHW